MKNILVIDTPSFGLEDAINCLKKLGYNVIKFSSKELFERQSEKFDNDFLEVVKKEKIDIVFSINFYPIVSSNCKELGLKYISIVYDSPHIALYHYTLINECNYVFIFDYAMYEELKKGGINTVYYMPLPVDVDRYDSMKKEDDKYKSDVSFVGHFYNESHTLYDRLCDKLKEIEGGQYVKGYLDAVVEAQSRIDGYYFAEKMIDDKILEKMKEAYLYEAPKDSIATDMYVYGNYFLGRKATEIARVRILKKVAEKFSLTLYTPNEVQQIKNAKNMGSVDWYNDTPKAFYNSKINLNITLKSIKTGIPFRVLDIMAAGGFVITNYQEDMFRHFEPDVDFVYYTDEEDLMEKIAYYLEHEEERKQIAENGHRKVREICNYKDVLEMILSEIG